MPSQQSPHDDLDELPGFAPTMAPEEFSHPDSSQTDYPDQETTSTHPLPDELDETPPAPRPPLPRSLESISPFVDKALENLGGNAFELFGTLINKTVRVRTKTNTELWLVTDEEAEAFGSAAGRIGKRHIPEELMKGDAGDLIVMGSVVVGYGLHNAAGVTGGELDSPAPVAQVPQYPQGNPLAGPPPPPPMTAPEKRQDAPRPAAGVDVDEATPAPPDVISPLI